MLLECLFAAIGTALATGGYVAFLIDPDKPSPMVKTVAALLCAVVFGVIQYCGVKLQAKFTNFLTYAAVLTLFAFWVLAIPDFDLGRILTTPLLPKGWSGVLAAIPFALWWLVIIEAVALASEEANEPHRTIPRGMVWAQVTLAILVLFTWLTASGSSAKDVGTVDYPLSLVIKHYWVNGPWSRWFSFFALSGMIVSYNGMIYATTRQAFALGRAGYFPKWLGEVHNRFRTPSRSILACTALTMACILLGHILPNATAQAILVSTLTAVLWYALAMLCLWRLRKTAPELSKRYQVLAYPALPLFVASLSLVCACLYVFYNPAAFWYTVAFYAVLLIWFGWRGRGQVLASAPEEIFRTVAARVADRSQDVAKSRAESKIGERRPPLLVDTDVDRLLRRQRVSEKVAKIGFSLAATCIIWIFLRALHIVPPWIGEYWEVVVVIVAWAVLFVVIALLGIFSTHSPTFAEELSWKVGLCGVGVLCLTTTCIYLLERPLKEEDTNQEALEQVRGFARSLDDFISRVAVIPRTLAARQATIGPQPDALTIPLLARVIREFRDDRVYGAYVAFENKDWRAPDAMPWVDQKNNPVHLKYDYHQHADNTEWYQGPKKTRQLYITEPYFDKGGSDIDMVSVTVPVYDREGKFMGVAGTDISLDAIRDSLKDIHLRGTPEGSLDECGQLLASGTGKLIAYLPSNGSNLAGSSLRSIEDVPGGREVQKRESDWTTIPSATGMRRLYWATSKLAQWKVGLSVPEYLVTAPVRHEIQRVLAISLAGILLLVIVTFFFASQAKSPVQKLTKQAEQRLREAGVEQRLPPALHRLDEIDQLKLVMTALIKTSDEEKERIRAGDTFWSILSHDIKQPVHCILNELDAIPENEANADYIEVIKNNANQLRRVVEERLNLSKAQSGAMPLSLTDISVHDLLAEIRQGIAPACEAKRNSLEISCTPPDLGMHVDRTMLENVLRNLVDNANKFTKEGVISISADTNGDLVFFEVSDSGAGIEADKLPSVFKPFFQAQQGGGWGLGLPVALCYCNLMGGDITVDSIVGKGTVMRVQLPVIVVDRRSAGNVRTIQAAAGVLDD